MSAGDFFQWFNLYYGHGEFGVIYSDIRSPHQLIKLVNCEIPNNREQAEFFDEHWQQDIEGLVKIHSLAFFKAKSGIINQLQERVATTNTDSVEIMNVLTIREGDELAMWVMEKTPYVGLTHPDLTRDEMIDRVSEAAYNITTQTGYDLRDLLPDNYGFRDDGSAIIFDFDCYDWGEGGSQDLDDYKRDIRYWAHGHLTSDEPRLIYSNVGKYESFEADGSGKSLRRDVIYEAWSKWKDGVFPHQMDNLTTPEVSWLYEKGDAYPPFDIEDWYKNTPETFNAESFSAEGNCRGCGGNCTGNYCEVYEDFSLMCNQCNKKGVHECEDDGNMMCDGHTNWFPIVEGGKLAPYCKACFLQIDYFLRKKEGQPAKLNAESFESESSLPKAYIMQNFEKKIPYEIHVAGCNHGNLAGGDSDAWVFGDESSSIKNTCKTFIEMWVDNFQGMPKEMKPSDAEIDAINNMTFSKFMKNKYVKNMVPVKLSPCCKKDIRIKEYCDNNLVKDIVSVRLDAEYYGADNQIRDYRNIGIGAALVAGIVYWFKR